MTFHQENSNFTKWVKTKFADLSSYLHNPLCLCVSVFRYRCAGKIQLPNLGLIVYDDALVNAAMNQELAKVRALQKSFKLKTITVKVAGGGELDVPKFKFSLAGVEDDQVIVRPEMKIAKLPN